MGCCSALPASAPASEASGCSSSSGQPIEVVIDGSDGSEAKVLIASASYCYCLLISSAAIFLDVRNKESFNKGHLYGAWCLHSHVSRDVGDASKALKSLCDLRRVVVISETNPLEDDKVKRLLELLQKTARPSRVLLMDNLPQFQQRFPFCMRQGSETFPLPPCPTELWVPEPEKRPSHAPALYLGPVTCLERRHEALQCFKIGAVVQLVDDVPNPTPPLPRAIKLQRVQVAKMDLASCEGTESETLDLAAKVAAASLEVSERILSLRVPCFLCGPWSAVVAALALRRIFVSELRTTEELCGFLKDRCATMALPHVAILAINLALGSPSPELAPAQAAQLRKRLGPEAEVPLQTVRGVLEKVLDQPSQERFRRLKASNPRVQREVLAHPEAVLLLRLAGFTLTSGDLLLPSTAALGPVREEILTGHWSSLVDPARCSKV